MEQYQFRKQQLQLNSTEESLGRPMHSYDRLLNFSMVGGTIDLSLKNGDYLVGKIKAGLTADVSPTPNDDRKYIISAEGDVTINLGSRGALMDLITNSDSCKEQPFTETRRHPANGVKHLWQDRPIIAVDFSDDIQQDSVTNQTFQVGYPNQQGEFINVSGRFINKQSRIQFVPDSGLREGVRYSIKVKTGETGIRSASNVFLPDNDGSGWHETDFWTELPFANEVDGIGNMSCDTYQTVRNAPLILDKPALIRVYADWPKFSDVHPDAQYKEFNAKISLSDDIKQPLGSMDIKFTRPDLRENWGKEKLRIEEAGELPFVPANGYPHRIVRIETNTNDSKIQTANYNFYCAGSSWTIKEPTLSVDVFALDHGEYGYDDDAGEDAGISQEQTALLIKRMTSQAKEFAEQLYPFKTITFSEPKFTDIVIKSDNINEVMSETSQALNTLMASSNADVILLVGPHEVFSGGGRVYQRITDGQGLMYMSVGASIVNYDKYLLGIVHELGHVLTLDHNPYIAESRTRDKLLMFRGFRATQYYQGIDSIKMSNDGTVWWHKSSRLGNEESEHIAPLMYPGLLRPEDVFIPRNQYRNVQWLLESLEKKLTSLEFST